MSDILVIGGTGNMGRPLVKSLVEGGHRVSVVCRRKVNEEETLRLANAGGMYLYGDAKDRQFMDEVLRRHYDAIVDFCIYSSEEFRERVNGFLNKTDQYVCLSTAAVYADIPTPKNESSPRYMEVDPPEEGTEKWGWYCYEKARIEDMLHKSGKRNWTIVRPGVTMNANHVGWGLWWNDKWLGRIIRGRKVVVEKDVLDFKFSLSSGTQVALLIGSLIGNEKALGEVFNVCSSEVWSWQKLLDAYKSIVNKCGYRLKIAYVNSQDVINAHPGCEYVYTRARLLDRVFDNAKIVSVIPPLPLGKSMDELLKEWTESYIRNYKRPIVSQSGQLRQMVEMDNLAGDCSSRHDFCSLRLYVKYLLMRCRPSIISRLKILIRKTFLRLHLGRLYNLACRARKYVHQRREKRAIRRNYTRIVKRIRSYPKDKKIRVLFWVYETAKWKAQSLYDEMNASTDFEPIIVLSVTREDWKFYGKGIREKLLADEKYYTSHGCRCITNFDFSTERPFPLAKYEPDIVFYHDPCWLFEEDSVGQTAKSALCCDIPYAIRTLAGDGLQNAPHHHQLMFLQFPPTDAQSHYYRKSLPEWKWAGTSYAIGHPILDQYLTPADNPASAEFVIYAPHWSFAFKGVKRETTLSSFLGNGRQILEYAQQHPEFKWVFKPHPRLYKELIKREVWTKKEVDAYYDEWGKIGIVCTDGDYIRLFRNAKALITDCGSFLVEFPMTGKPLIRLIPKELHYPLFPAFEKLYNSFYQARNLDEMYAAFALVLERGEDPRMEARLNAVHELGLMGNGSSAGRIMNKLREVCGRRQ